MATVQELLVKITGDASSFQKAVQETKNAGTQIGDAFQSVGDRISSVGKTATATLTVPIVGAATAAVKNFAEVDKTMMLTNQTMANSAQDAKILEDAMKSAASNSIFGMQDAATASLNFARAGLSATEAASALAPAMNLAAGEGGNLDTVSAGLVATINGFGDSFTKTSDYADVFASACNNSALDIDSLSRAMSTAAPIFATAGYSVNDAALYMGVMADAGIPASEAANSLKTGLARLVSPAKEGYVAMKQLGIEVTNADGSMKDSITIQKELHDAFSGLSESEQIAAASAIFGKNQMSKWLALINTAPSDVQNLSNSINDCKGTTDEMAEAMMSGFGGSLEKLKSSIDVASYSFGNALAPAISQVADKIQEVVDWFNSLSEEQQQQVAKIAAITAAAGPLLIIFGKLTSSVGSIIGLISKLGPVVSSLGSAFSAAGAGAGAASGGLAGIASAAAPVVAVIAAIVAAVYSLIESFGGVEGTIKRFKEAFQQVADSVKRTADNLKLGEKIDKLKEKFKGLLDALGNMRSFWEILITIFTKAASVVGGNLTAAFNTLVDAVTAVIQIITGVIEIVSGLADVIVGVFTGDMDKAAEGFKKIWQGVKDYFGGIVTGVINLVKDLVQQFIENFKTLKYNLIGDPIVIDIVNGIIKAFTDLVKNAVELIENFVKDIIEFFTKLKDKVVDTVNNLKDKIKEKFTEIKEKVTDLVTQLKEKVTDKFNEIKEQIVEKVTNAKDKAKEKFTEMKTAVVDKMKETVSNVKQKLDEMVNKFKGISLVDIGRNIINGFLDGLKNAWETVKSWVSSACDAIKSKFESAMKIGSPSKVFFQYGKWIDEGLVNGLQVGMPNINSMIDRMNKTVSTNFNAVVEGQSGSVGATTINLNGDYMFQDKASMDYFLNRMQLALQRA